MRGKHQQSEHEKQHRLCCCCKALMEMQQRSHEPSFSSEHQSCEVDGEEPGRAKFGRDTV